jgi:hypothetical protein
MAHCGYETTAVNDTIKHPLKALRVFLGGPKTDGPFSPELPIAYSVDGTGKPQSLTSHTDKGKGI